MLRPVRGDKKNAVRRKTSEIRCCRPILKNRANINRSRATALCHCPRIHHPFRSDYITSIQNKWQSVVVFLLQSGPRAQADPGAAVSL